MRTELRGEGHTSKAAHGAGDDGDDRNVGGEVENGRVYGGNGCEAERGLLQAHAAGFKEQQRSNRLTETRRLSGKFESRCDLGAADFSNASAFEAAFNGDGHDRMAIDAAADGDDAIVRLRHKALLLQPWRADAVERAGQLTEVTKIEKRGEAFAG